MIGLAITLACAAVTAKPFPIAVWLQEPSNAAKYKAAGFNLYIGLWQGPTEAQLSELKRQQMPVICEQTALGLKHKSDPIIYGWMHQDEPDNAQPVKDPATGRDGYGPCVPPSKIGAEYRAIKEADPSRPVILNLGQGVANDEWIGRGNGSSLKDYETYVNGGDIVSYDIYPIAGLPKPAPENYLWMVAKGLDRLGGWMHGKGTRWNCIECTRIDGNRKASPEQVRSEVWMSIIHGSKGLIYFVHQFKPTFDEHALLDDPEMLAAVTKLNTQIQSLSDLIQSPDLPGLVSVSSTQAPVDAVVKKGKVILSVGMRNAATRATFSGALLRGAKQVEVVDEARTIPVVGGKFEDDFKAYQPHIYRVR